MTTTQRLCEEAGIKEIMNYSAPGVPKIETNSLREDVTAQLIKNTQTNMNESLSGVANMETWSPILMSMVRRAVPKLIAYDVMGVQPMTAPTTLIFALKARYGVGADAHTPAEAMGVKEVDTGYSGTGTDAQVGASPKNSFDSASYPDAAPGTGKATTAGEIDPWAQMGITIEKTAVEAKTRQLRADYSPELAEDMSRIHGLNARTELINALSNEIVSEMNREMIRTIYSAAKPGAQWTATPGAFDLSTDSGGRWANEKFKGLHFAIERDANRVSLETRRGRGNKLIVSADVASAFVAAGILDFAPGLQAQMDLEVDPTTTTYAGKMGHYDVYIDPYAVGDGYVIGYRGDRYDAGIFYCPYIPLQMYAAVTTTNFTNALGFKTRYGLVANPFTSLNVNSNVYYRKTKVSSLI